MPYRAPDRGLDEVQSGAVDLFVRRARMVKPTFALTPANVDCVVALCQRLDGLPLAIELAAARSRLLSPQALLHRIDDVASGAFAAADRSERQRTLWSTISWSYDLLDERDRRVFRQLGVFSSRFGMDAVAHVVGVEDRDPLDVVAHLVDVSLVEVVEGPDGEPMIFMLETIRRFARGRLEASQEHAEVLLAHARWCLQVARQISALLTGPRQMSALDRMEAVEEDIRAALDWCLAPTATPTGERAQCGYALLEPMDSYWYRFGYIAEGRGWHDRAMRLLASADVPDSPQVVDALHGQGSSRSSSSTSPPAASPWSEHWRWRTAWGISPARPASRTASGSPGERAVTCPRRVPSSSAAWPSRAGSATVTERRRR